MNIFPRSPSSSSSLSSSSFFSRSNFHPRGNLRLKRIVNIFYKQHHHRRGIPKTLMSSFQSRIFCLLSIDVYNHVVGEAFSLLLLLFHECFMLFDNKNMKIWENNVFECFRSKKNIVQSPHLSPFLVSLPLLTDANQFSCGYIFMWLKKKEKKNINCEKVVNWKCLSLNEREIYLQDISFAFRRSEKRFPMKSYKKWSLR